MLRRVSADELLARLDEIKVRFEKTEWLLNKKNLCAEENTMLTHTSDTRNPTLGLNKMTSQAPIVTDYDVGYDEDNYNDFFGFENESSMQGCYAVACKKDQTSGCSQSWKREHREHREHLDEKILDSVQAAVKAYAKNNSIVQCDDEYSAVNVGFVNCTDASGTAADYAMVTEASGVVQNLKLPRKFNCTEGMFG
jgi:hypothetical protein